MSRDLKEARSRGHLEKNISGRGWSMGKGPVVGEGLACLHGRRERKVHEIPRQQRCWAAASGSSEQPWRVGSRGGQALPSVLIASLWLHAESRQSGADMEARRAGMRLGGWPR